MEIRRHCLSVLVVFCFVSISAVYADHIGPDYSIVVVEEAARELCEFLDVPMVTTLGEDILLAVNQEQLLQIREKGIDYLLVKTHRDSVRFFVLVTDDGERSYDNRFPVSILYQNQYHSLVTLPPKKQGDTPEEYIFTVPFREVRFDTKPYHSVVFLQRPFLERQDVVQTLLDQVSEETIVRMTRNLSGMDEVMIEGSPFTIMTRHSREDEMIQKATQFAYEHFEGLGYEVSFHTFDGPGDRNVIAIKNGTKNPEIYCMLCAHIDDMPPGDLAPGADDNASGSVAVMLAAELFRDIDSDISIIFALWTGEEQGLHGSYNYAHDAYDAGMDIKGVLNLDMIAWDDRGAPIIELHANQYSQAYSVVLAEMMVNVISEYQLDLEPQIIPFGISASDHASFWEFGYPAILAIEDFEDFNDYYHTVNDRLEHLNIPYYVEFVKASVATLYHLAQAASLLEKSDIDGSGRIDGLDLMILESAFGTSLGDERYREDADFDDSGLIDEADLEVIVGNFGKILQ